MHELCVCRWLLGFDVGQQLRYRSGERLDCGETLVRTVCIAIVVLANQYFTHSYIQVVGDEIECIRDLNSAGVSVDSCNSYL